jgi:hypothetical protein
VKALHKSARLVMADSSWIGNETHSSPLYSARKAVGMKKIANGQSWLFSFPTLSAKIGILQSKPVKDFYPDQFEKHFEVYITTGDSYEKRQRQFAQQSYDKFVVTSALG